MKIYQITSSFFTAGIVVDDGELNNRVIDAAPIVKYLKRWTMHEVRNYCDRRKWEIIEVL